MYSVHGCPRLRQLNSSRASHRLHRNKGLHGSLAAMCTFFWSKSAHPQQSCGQNGLSAVGLPWVRQQSLMGQAHAYVVGTNPFTPKVARSSQRSSIRKRRLLRCLWQRTCSRNCSQSRQRRLSQTQQDTGVSEGTRSCSNKRRRSFIPTTAITSGVTLRRRHSHRIFQQNDGIDLPSGGGGHSWAAYQHQSCRPIPVADGVHLALSS